MNGLILTMLATSLLSAQVLAQTQVRLQSYTDLATFSEGYNLSVDAWSTQTKQSSALHSPQVQHKSHAQPQVWISDIGALLVDDIDNDSYFSGFSLTIDVDSEYGDTDVYAKIYVQSDTQPLMLLHKTSRFSVYGSTRGDEYRIDTELRNNFASDTYNLVIDIHDAWSDDLLDTANSRGFSNLRNLPLESSEQNLLSDNLEQDIVTEFSSADVVVTEHAGGLHPALLLLLLGSGLVSRRLRLKNNHHKRLP